MNGLKSTMLADLIKGGFRSDLAVVNRCVELFSIAIISDLLDQAIKRIGMRL